jgi:hypothetical protein
MKEELHRQFAELVPVKGNWLRMLGHALIELGVVKVLECSRETCLLESRKFDERVKYDRSSRASLSIDHIQEKCAGGSDLPSNLRFVHLACNSSRKLSQEQKDKIAATVKKNWENPEYRTKVSSSLKRHWADPEAGQRHYEGVANGKRQKS